MAGDDDPFGLENDAGRTRIRPVRQNRPVMTGRAGDQDAARVDVAPARIRQARAGDNPLISAFSVLLGLAPELERATAPDNPDVLRTRMHDNLIYSRDNAVSAGVPMARADQGAWFVAALIDDIILNTPWGSASAWPRQPLVTQLSGDVDAGERFYDKLDELMRYPDRDRDMLELAYMALSLGFRGRHRVHGASGEAAIAQLRTQLARTFRDDEDAELSPHWQGVVAPDKPPRFIVPLWSIALIAAGLIGLIYVGLSIRLTSQGEQLYTLIEVLPPEERADIYRPVIETVAPEPAPIEPFSFELLPLFAEAAPADTVAALTGRENPSLAVVVVQSTSPEVFRSARAELNGVYSPLVRSVAQVITENIELIGGITVVGHTDSIPVQASNPFLSNQGLSEARARTIAEALRAAGVPADIIKSEGRAASEPIGDNATRPGRARNRRVEIKIEKRV